MIDREVAAAQTRGGTIQEMTLGMTLGMIREMREEEEVVTRVGRQGMGIDK